MGWERFRLIRFFLKSKTDEYDNAEILADLEKYQMAYEWGEWIKIPSEERTLFSDYLIEKYPNHQIFDIGEVEEYSVEF
jgi:hypothetical protein